MSKSMINNRFLEETVFAIADGYCVINLTKNYVPGVMYQVIDGRQYNLNEQLGLPEDSSLQSLVDAWALTIPKEGLSDFLKEFDRERLLKRFENGERHISFRYWTRTATIENLNLLLAEDNELNAEIAEMLLSDEGAKITVVKNGLQAVKAFQENPCNYFDAILRL